MSIGLFFGTTCGATEETAREIQKVFGGGAVALHDIDTTDPEAMAQYDKIILGAPTMGSGELSGAWRRWSRSIMPEYVQGKTVAMYGLGDQLNYPENFADALGMLWDQMTIYGAHLVGEWPKDGYGYECSNAERDNRFVGLIIDDDNQPAQTSERVQRWVASIRDLFV